MIRQDRDQALRISEHQYEQDIGRKRSFIRTKPEGMTANRWTKEKRGRRLLAKEESRQACWRPTRTHWICF